MDQATTHELILVFVAYHPAAPEVLRLHECLSQLPAHIGYAVVVNDYDLGEPVDLLRGNAVLFLTNKTNPGYGRAVNQAVRMLSDLGRLPAFVGALNTDLAWSLGTFRRILEWLKDNNDIVLAVPRLINPRGELQKLCKQNPTILGLLSRRFIPAYLKFPWLSRYDDWFIMADADYNQIMDVPYLSGCCMLFRTAPFVKVGGFDERFFLYLEDADLTRALQREGRTVHYPLSSVVHHWGRGNHSSKKLTLVNLHSAWIYFRKWGISLL